MKRLVAALMVASMLSFGPAAARGADRYPDEDKYEDAFSHPLRLAYYIIHPVGYTLEWLVMRPLHFVFSRPKLDKVFGYEPIGEEGMYDRKGEHM
ncbi:MAG: hypothetical protein AB7V27_11620 [Candidatus Binatia bacterium]